MHERIERGIGNNECKEIFKNECEQRETKLIEDIERRFKECEEKFRGSVRKNIEQLEERVQDSLAMLKCIGIGSGNSNFNTDFNMDSGIDKIGLFSSIGGLVLLLLTPVVGEFALIAGVGLALVGVGKAVWGFFDSDYKKSQQRKEMNKNLDKACEIIAEAVKSRIESYKKGASEMIENLKASLNDLIVCYKCMREGLIKAGEDLWHLDDRIKTTLKQRIVQ
ncbi:apolipoL family protein [Helicobacter pylori]|uniref:apolipoL family protein n=1 Tax=Helicobacter pylori TaxID=210 RepID=UPI001F0B7DFA|nr:apolipoL family protein [Helicobacter pylori]